MVEVMVGGTPRLPSVTGCRVQGHLPTKVDLSLPAPLVVGPLVVGPLVVGPLVVGPLPRRRGRRYFTGAHELPCSSAPADSLRLSAGVDLVMCRELMELVVSRPAVAGQASVD